MHERPLFVRRQEALSVLGGGPFRALPREEVEHFFASVEVLNNLAPPLGGQDVMRLAIGVAVHFNHQWLTISGAKGNRSLVLSSLMTARGTPPLFLDAEFEEAGRRYVDATLAAVHGYELRLAGLLWEKALLMVLCVARLRHPGVEWREKNDEGVAMHGHLELLHLRPQLDGASQIVVDHLSAF